MRNWIAFVQKHHDIIILQDNSIYIPRIGYNAKGEWVDHLVTKHDGLYHVEELHSRSGQHNKEWKESTIKNYLGY
jgi:hypothetical protein